VILGLFPCISITSLTAHSPLFLLGLYSCPGITVYNGLRKVRETQGVTVGVQGIGGLGHLAIQVCSLGETLPNAWETLFRAWETLSRGWRDKCTEICSSGLSMMALWHTTLGLSGVLYYFLSEGEEASLATACFLSCLPFSLLPFPPFLFLFPLSQFAVKMGYKVCALSFFSSFSFFFPFLFSCASLR